MGEPARILLVEDDPVQSEWIAEEVIWKASPDAEILFFSSEYSFAQGLKTQKIQGWRPQYAVLDLLVRFYSIEDLAEMSSAPDFSNTPDPIRAGIRCHDELSRECPYIRSVIITVIDPPEGNFKVIQKGSAELINELREFLSI